jgi:adenosylhomocysteine nucleosidase
MVMRKRAIVAALEREVCGLVGGVQRIEREHDGRKFVFFELDESVVVCGGIGVEAARRASEAVIALYHPPSIQSVGFAGALQSNLRVGDVMQPAVVIDARDGSRIEIEGGEGVLLTFGAVASRQQKNKLAQAYAAQAVDMEAAAVAAAARAHGVPFAAIKVISDELDFEMAETARFIDAQGRFKTSHFALFLALRPWLWRRAFQLALNSGKAASVLSEHLKKSPRPLHDEVVEAKTT